MQMKRVHLLLIPVVMSVLVGCGGTEEDFEQELQPATVEQALEQAPPPETTELAEMSNKRPPPNGMNGTTPSCFWAHGSQRALRALGGGALDQGAGALPNIPLSQVSESCRHVLRSAVECALTPDQSVRDPVTGEVYTGWWGLAPSWLGDVLNTEGRRYVTACMVQRLNFYGTPVPILLEGPSPALAASTSFASQYPLAESTVYGDLFSSSTPLGGILPAFNVFMCWESLLPQSCGLLNLPLLFEKRICDDLPLCGLLPVGPCALSCVENGPYWKCRPGLLFTPAWKETVRVRLETATCR